MDNSACKLLFIDYSVHGFKRYAEDIISEIHNINSEVEFIAVYMEESNDVYSSKFNKMICAKKLHYNPDVLLDVYSPNGIVVFAHRFFDYMFTVSAHKRGIPVFNFQHGLYMDSTVVSKLTKKSFFQLLKKKREQMKIYSKCLYYLNDKHISKMISMMFDFSKKMSMYEVINTRLGTICNADFSFIYGSFWKDFYSKHYFESKTNYHIIGYPELEGRLISAKSLFQNDLPIICYLAQTSVEDGIVEKKDLDAFLKVIEQSLGIINIIIKLHPRSDLKLYNNIISNYDNVIVWNQPDFPKCDCYIGHESTVIGRALYITNKTMIYRLCPERISPFEKYTEYLCLDSNSFFDRLNTMLSATNDLVISKELESYIYNNPFGSIKETAEIICNNI